MPRRSKSDFSVQVVHWRQSVLSYQNHKYIDIAITAKKVKRRVIYKSINNQNVQKQYVTIRSHERSTQM